MEFRRKVRAAEMLSSAMKRLSRQLPFTDRLSFVVHNGRVPKSGDEEGHFRHPTQCQVRASTAVVKYKSEYLDPDLWLYRKRTMALLRRCLRLSVEVGRLPSLLGREFLRTRVTSYHARTFEDAVIFVHDVGRGLEKLNPFENM